MATIGMTMAAISPADNLLPLRLEELVLPFEGFELESLLKPGVCEEDEPSADCVTPAVGIEKSLPPAADVGLLPFPGAVVEISANIVPLVCPQPREIWVLMSPTLLDRAYVTHAGASDELDNSPPSVPSIMCL